MMQSLSQPTICCLGLSRLGSLKINIKVVALLRDVQHRTDAAYGVGEKCV